MAYQKKKFFGGLACGLSGQYQPAEDIKIIDIAGEEAAVCYYNGIKCPPLPEMKYHHAYITRDSFDTSGEVPLSLTVFDAEARPVFLDNGDTSYNGKNLVGYGFLSTVQYKRWKFDRRKNAVAWVEDEESFASQTFWRPANQAWSNTDILFADGSVAFAASEPVPITNRALGWLAGRRLAWKRKKPLVPEGDDSMTPDDNVTPSQLWETLFEGEVVAENNNGENGYFDVVTFDPTPLFTKNEGIRVTINGVSHIATAVWFNGGASVGNVWLYQKTEETEEDDNGLDYFISTSKTFLVPTNFIRTREPGTYTVKIERALFEPVAYLYNGERLKKKPVYDEKDFPYAVIDDSNRLHVFTAPVGFHYNSTMGWIARTLNGEIMQIMTADMSSDSPSFGEVNEATFITVWLGDQIWSNFDLIQYNEDSTETLILEPSDPVPVYDDNPVAYLYNGVRLPAFPGWDSEAYPYAFIFEVSETNRRLVVSNVKPVYNGSDIYVTAPYRYAVYYSNKGQFELVNWYSNNTTSHNFTSPIIWTNEDIQKTNGTIYLSASKPIPVYE